MSEETEAKEVSEVKKLDIKETKEMVTFVAKLGMGLEASLDDDGKLSFGDVSNMMPALMSSGAAFAGAGKIGAEFKDMDKAEGKELCDHLASELDLKDDKIEAIVERSMTLGKELFMLINDLKEAKKD